MAGVDVPTRVGVTCSPERRGLIPPRDMSGPPMPVDAGDDRRPVGVAENTVFGPFHVADAPSPAMGGAPAPTARGSCPLKGRVAELSGAPVEGARLDLRPGEADGSHDMRKPGVRPRRNTRGRLPSAADGRRGSRVIRPVSRPPPTTGPRARCSPPRAAIPSARLTCT